MAAGVLTMARISRRAGVVAALLAGTRSAPATTAPGAAAVPPCATQDSKLAGLARQLLEAVIEEEQLVAPYYRLVRFSYPADVAAQLDALARQQTLLRQQIAALSAVTLPGLQAKARIVMLWLAPERGGPMDEEDGDADLALSLCRDLLDCAAA